MKFEKVSILIKYETAMDNNRIEEISRMVRKFDRLLADKRNHRIYALIEKSRIYK